MKVLFVGYKNPRFGAVTDYIELALREMGHEVRFMDYRAYALPGRLRDRVGKLESWDRARINETIGAAARDWRPELFLVNGGWTLEPETIRAAREAGAATALWTSDYPYLVDRYIALAPHYDHYFLSGTDVVEHFRLAGNERGHFLPFACLPSLHKPVKLEGKDAERFRSDVAFAGTAYPERVSLLSAAAKLGIELAIWGPGWDRLPEGHPLRRSVRGAAIGSEDFVRAASGCKVAFNHMGYPMRPQLEELCNSRVFELLGCGAFQLVDAKKDVKLLFESGRELVSFSGEKDFLEKLRYFLDHAGEREAIARRGREAALAKHTYGQRLAELIEACGLKP